MNSKNNNIPIFFAIDDNYAIFLTVALKSIMATASKDYIYNIHVLSEKLSDEHISEISSLANDNFKIYFNNISETIKGVADKLQLRDYYTLSIYYRLFIQSMFPEYDKAIYLDSDLVCLKDISMFFNINIDSYLLAATPEEVMHSVDAFGKYSEFAVGVKRENYFNSGILLLNLKKFREEKIEEKFLEMLEVYKFKVAPDQDYLNLLCKDMTLLLPAGYNKTPVRLNGFDSKDLFFVHYKINWKPWKYSGIMYEKYFWKYAKQTKYYSALLAMRDNYSGSQKKVDSDSYFNLVKLAKDETIKFEKLTIFKSLGGKNYGKIAR